MDGTLYVVATPIGNLSDITIRAKEVLSSVDFILAEDTRVVRNITKYLDIQNNTLIYHQHSGNTTKEKILNLLNSGQTLALVTDAGTPGVSDPGNELIDYLLSNNPNIKIVPIPGPSALTTALSVCGFNVSQFIFVGFLPKRKRQKLFEWLSQAQKPFVFFDSPFRIRKTLEELKDIFPDRRVFIAREITKLHESLYRGTFDEVLSQLPSKIKGEITVIVEGVPGKNRTSISGLGNPRSIR